MGKLNKQPVNQGKKATLRGKVVEKRFITSGTDKKDVRAEKKK